MHPIGCLLCAILSVASPCVPPMLPPETALRTSGWTVTKSMEVTTMDGKRDFGVVSANMLQLDSMWKWNGADGLVVASASQSMLMSNGLTQGPDAPVLFTVCGPSVANCEPELPGGSPDLHAVFVLPPQPGSAHGFRAGERLQPPAICVCARAQARGGHADLGPGVRIPDPLSKQISFCAHPGDSGRPPRSPLRI